MTHRVFLATVLCGLIGSVCLVHQLSRVSADTQAFSAKLFKTVDGGATWAEMDTGIQTHAFLKVLVAGGDGQTVYTGTSSGLFTSHDGGSTWTATNPLNPLLNLGDIALIPSEPQRILALAQCAPSSTDLCKAFSSSDGGVTWTQLGNDVKLTEAQSLTVLSSNPSTVLVGAQRDYDVDTVFRSKDKGSSWSLTGVPVGLAFRVHDVSSSPSDPSTAYLYLFADEDNAGFYKSSDGGSSFSMLPSGFFDRFRTLAVDPNNSSILYGLYGAGMLVRSVDGGLTYSTTQIQGAPDANLLALSAADSSTIYAGGQNGVFKSADQGSTWSPTSLTAAVSSLTVDPTNPLVAYAGTSIPFPHIGAISKSGKNLIVNGTGFRPGTRILVNGVSQRTKNDPNNPTTTLIGKKVLKGLTSGQYILVQVQDPDGTMNDDSSNTYFQVP